MLVLSRKVGERIVIGDDIAIVVNRIAGNRVTIGIEAPGDVRIVRGELAAFAEPLPADAAEPERRLTVAELIGALAVREQRAPDETHDFAPRLAR